MLQSHNPVVEQHPRYWIWILTTSVGSACSFGTKLLCDQVTHVNSVEVIAQWYREAAKGMSKLNESGTKVGGVKLGRGGIPLFGSHKHLTIEERGVEESGTPFEEIIHADDFQECHSKLINLRRYLFVTSPCHTALYNVYR